MGDSGANLQTTLDNMAATIKTLQTTVEANALAIQRLTKAQQQSSSSSGNNRCPSDEHHNDRPPRFQKLDSPPPL